MSEERDKLIQVMNSLEADYKSGKISTEKYRYFRSKYEDKLNSIDAMEATKRIRSMQGKSPSVNNKKRRKPTNSKKKEEQDLVQKYIINPKKDDAKYNRQKKSSMGSGTFRLIAVLVLVIAFTAGVAYGIFNLDTETVANTDVVATVQDTAFPEIVAVVNTTTTNFNDTTNNTHAQDTSDDKNNNNNEVETTRETTTTTTTTQDSSSSSSSSSDSSSSSSSSSSDSSSSSSSSSDSGSDSSSSDSSSSSEGDG